jgi:hypothetical protein
MAKKTNKKNSVKLDIKKETFLDDLKKIGMKKEERKNESPKPEDEEIIPRDFSFISSNSVLSSGNLVSSLKESGATQTKLETAAGESKDKESGKKEESRKLYENVYESRNKLYEDKKKEEPEIRVHSKFVRPTEVENFHLTQDFLPVPKRVGMVHDERMTGVGRVEEENPARYEMSRRRDAADSNPFNNQLDIKEKKYKI